MPIISIIAAVDESNGIGRNNKLLCHLPADLKHFKTLTMGKPIIMGRKTFDSIGKPLPGRKNIVLSHKDLLIEGVDVVDSLEKALNLCKEHSELMIIGGAQIYNSIYEKADRLYITHIHHQFNADTYFPKISEKEWLLKDKEVKLHDELNPFDMTFCTYLRKTPI